MNKLIATAAAALLSSSALAATPENGWWWNPSQSGSGFNIEVQRGKMFVSTFVYDENGNPVWYSGAGDAGEPETHITLLRYQGGSCIGCEYSKPSVSGKEVVATFNFSSPANGVVNILGKRSSIFRLNFGFGNFNQKMMGEWVLVSSEISSSGNYWDMDRVVFDATNDDGSLLIGSRLGVPYIKAETGKITGWDEDYTHAMRVGQEDGLGKFYVFNFSGLNKIEGKRMTVSGDIEPYEWDWIVENGEKFEGYRMK